MTRRGSAGHRPIVGFVASKVLGFFAEFAGGVLGWIAGVIDGRRVEPRPGVIIGGFNPLVYVVDAPRVAFIGDLTGTTVGFGVGIAVALSITAVRFGVRTFQRESA